MFRILGEPLQDSGYTIIMIMIITTPISQYVELDNVFVQYISNASYSLEDMTTYGSFEQQPPGRSCSACMYNVQPGT